MTALIVILSVVFIIAIAVIYKLVSKQNTDTVYNKYEIQNNIILPVKVVKTTNENNSAKQLSALPKDVALDDKGLPYKINRKYLDGWGKQFNAFVTLNGEYYHKSKCRCCKGHTYKCIHVYNAIKAGYKPCQICKPKDKIDDWYLV